MGLIRLAISNPAANTPTKMFTANEQYLLSIMATNKSASASNIRIWIQPNSASVESQYAFIVYELPVDANNAYETFRFAVNSLDEIYVQASSASVSFQAYGLVQYDVKIGAGVSSYSPNAPGNPVNGMIWVDSDAMGTGNAKPAYVYSSASTSWIPLVGGIDTSLNYNFTGQITLSASTSIGNISSAEIDYLNNASANIQTQLNTHTSQISAIPTDFQNIMAQRMFG